MAASHRYFHCTPDLGSLFLNDVVQSRIMWALRGYAAEHLTSKTFEEHLEKEGGKTPPAQWWPFWIGYSQTSKNF